MAYRFRRKETAADGFRRLAREQTAGAVSLLADQGNNLSGRIHDARRHLKRLRALLELVRHCAPAGLVNAEHDVLQEAARRLAITRDADVCLATFEALTASSRPEERVELHEYFHELARDARRALSHSRLAAIARLVRKSGLKIAEAKLENDGWALFQRDLERSLRHARKVRPPLKCHPGDQPLHEWRKAVKRLLHQLELFRAMLPKPQRKLLKALECLAEALGEHHDLQVIENSIRNYRFRAAKVGGLEFMDALIAARRKLLWKEIRKLNTAAFRDKPKTILRRVHRAWKRTRKGCA